MVPGVRGGGGVGAGGRHITLNRRSFSSEPNRCSSRRYGKHFSLRDRYYAQNILTLRYRIKRHKQIQGLLILRKENYAQYKLHCKKRLAIFLYPAGDAPARESLFSASRLGTGKSQDQKTFLVKRVNMNS